ncbi:MAG TPA: glycosyltransferase family 4 protein [Methylothermaceae bacterium]|nr:glycosyltransferase family 4 protein [Methylothermaceae bacterium]
MNIVMMTNTYLPHVGGVARSVSSFTEEYRRLGHCVLVVAPRFPGTPEQETDVVRVPALQNFNGSDFAVVLPLFSDLDDALDSSHPDLIHAHHPYLLGMTALREARIRGLPLVFTHHTRYEYYTHYVPMDSPMLKRFVIELATRYANLCDLVFAPSESIAELLRQRGVNTPVEVVPTGVRIEQFTKGDGPGFRHRHEIPHDAFVVGHVGRLAPEKNLTFLAEAVAGFLQRHPRAHFLVAGRGPSEAEIIEICQQHQVAERLHRVGVLVGQQLPDAYHAMDVFAFSSKSETQGLVLIEAMAAGIPVVALDAPGAREVVADRLNGRLVMTEDIVEFSTALHWVLAQPPETRLLLRQEAFRTAERFALPRTTEKALACYEKLLSSKPAPHPAEDDEAWEQLLRRIKTEWDIVREMMEAAGIALASGEPLSGDLNAYD